MLFDLRGDSWNFGGVAGESFSPQRSVASSCHNNFVYNGLLDPLSGKQLKMTSQNMVTFRVGEKRSVISVTRRRKKIRP